MLKLLDFGSLSNTEVGTQSSVGMNFKTSRGAICVFLQCCNIFSKPEDIKKNFETLCKKEINIGFLFSMMRHLKVHLFLPSEQQSLKEKKKILKNEKRNRAEHIMGNLVFNVIHNVFIDITGAFF